MPGETAPQLLPPQSGTNYFRDRLFAQADENTPAAPAAPSAPARSKFASFELTTGVLKFLYSLPTAKLSNEAAFIADYNGLVDKVNAKFHTSLGRLTAKTPDAKRQEKKRYYLPVNASSPSVVVIRPDPRLMLAHQLVGGTDQFLEYIGYYFQRGTPSYAATDVMDARTIFLKGKGECDERSVFLASYLESLGTNAVVINFLPPGNDRVGHTAVAITDGEYAGWILDPNLRIKATSLSAYLDGIDAKRVLNVFKDANGAVCMDRLFRKNELSASAVTALESHDSPKAAAELQKMLDKNMKEAEKQTPSFENIYKILLKHGIVSFKYD